MDRKVRKYIIDFSIIAICGGILIFQKFFCENRCDEIMFLGLMHRPIKTILVAILIFMPLEIIDFKNSRWIKRAYIVFASIFVLFIAIYYRFQYADTGYYFYKSPKAQNTVVIKYSGSYLYSDVEIYKKKWGVYLEKIFGGDIHRGFEVKWQDEDTMILQYYNSDDSLKIDIN